MDSMRLCRAPWVALLLSLVAGAATPDGGVSGAAHARLIPITSTVPEARRLFLQGRDEFEDFLGVESIADFQKAVALEPNFPLANAYLGWAQGGPEGLQRLQRAVDLAATLPDAERHFTELLLSTKQGDAPKTERLLKQLMQEAPDDWRVVFQFGELAFARHDWERAIASYRRALVMSDEPNRRCAAFNSLGYAEALVGHYDRGIAALQRCVEQHPGAPNPFDSLGDVQLAANQLADADASFHRSAATQPGFWAAWYGIAIVDFARGEWREGYTALARARATVPVLGRLYVDSIEAWALFTEGKVPQAYAKIDAFESAARAAKRPGQFYFALAPLTRASMLNEQGRYAEALAQANLCLERLKVSGLPGSSVDSLRKRALRRKVWAEAKLNAPTLDQTVATIDAEAKARPEDPELAGSLHLAHGAALMARKQLQPAIAELSRCHLDGMTEWSFELRLRRESDELCVWNLASVQEEAGDHAGAEKTRATLAHRLSRNPMTLYLRSRVAPAAATR